MYHTQEKKGVRLTGPVRCTREDAWLGKGYYFWDDEDDAVTWGIKKKKKTGRFEIYKAEIESENILDTVFNEEQYVFWRKQIEKTAKNIVKRTGRKPDIKEIGHYLYEKADWARRVDGILFQDIPQNDDLLLVERFFYRKRIQMAVYNIEIVKNFAFHVEMESN
jgi:hypothetical protein